MKALFDALNVVHGEEEKRSFLKLNMASFAHTELLLSWCSPSLHRVLPGQRPVFGAQGGW
jgi:hypothetical protein